MRRFQPLAHYGHFVVLRSSSELIGVINVTEIVRGSFQRAYLGCYGFLPHIVHGYMSEGLALVLRRVFRSLRLHRVEANIQPDNKASLRLFARAGFRWEGFSPRYLKV